jgi:thiol peroxidase
MKTAFLMDEVFLLNRGIIVLNKNNEVIYISRNENVHSQIDFKTLDIFLKTL